MQSQEQLSSTKTDTIESKLDMVNEKLTENSLAWEMLKEQKHTIKRLFIVIFVLIFLWFATVIGFGIYLNQFDFSEEKTETIEQVVEAEQQGDNNSVDGGDINYGVSKG